MKRRLLRESFERILDILQQISLHEKSPKLFIIYAHDNKSTGLEAYQETVKEYISWFKKIRFNVDSDKSPHGYGVAHEIGHRGASNDIFTNQVCLLPRTWHQQNVDYVLVFYSKVLASYMKYEREFKIEDTTYSDAICKTCHEIQASLHERSQEQWTLACNKVRTVQQRFSQAMKDCFHHVLTETALLSFTNRNALLDKTIPIIVMDDEDWEPELKWQPHFVHNKDTQLRITIKPDEEYQQFFKILLEFETLERDRPAIEVLMKCFQDAAKLLEEDPQPEKYRSQLEVIITEAMQNLNRQWQRIERPITRGDVRSRLALYSKLDVASIQRISGERFIGDIKDIDLAVIESTDGQIGRLEDKDGDIRQDVSLHNIFDEREVKHKTIRPERILIQGKPGIGKTTLCRRLMYEYFWNKDLRTKFDLVVRIPARKLERSVDLRSLFFEEYFEDAPNGYKLSEALESLVLAHPTVDSEDQVTPSIKILLILDGLEEVMRYSQGRHPLIERLIKGPAVIITSRFYDIKMPYVPIDLHLEALGLNLTNVEAYLDNNMFVAEDSARQIRGFIEASALVKDMIRAPIHLDIVCYSWDQLHDRKNAFLPIKNEGEISTPTMATIYQSVVRSLWRQDVSFLGKMDHGDPVTAETINAVQDIARLDRLVNTENYLLEELAINMLESDRIEFTNHDVADVIQHWESSGNQIPLSLENRVHKFSLLRSSSREGYRTFRFVHLTFQDFFAARYVVRSLVQGSSRLRSLLRKYKYYRQHELFWRFIPGLLTKVKDLDLFFQLLDQEPRDLLGIQHIRIVMHCLHEWPARLKSRRWEELVKRLENWWEMECRMDLHSDIGSSMAFPENILARKIDFQAPCIDIDRDVLRTICNRRSLSDDLLLSIIQLIHDNGIFQHIKALDLPVSRRLMDGIQKEHKSLYYLSKSQKVKIPLSSIFFLFGKIQETIRDDSSDFILEGMRLLINQPTLPENVMEKLEEWFSSEDPRLATEANYFLRDHLQEHHRQEYQLSKKTIDHAVEQLIRESGVYGLGWSYRWIIRQKDLPSENVGRILALLLQITRKVPGFRYFQLFAGFTYPKGSLHPDNVGVLGMLLHMCLHHDQLQEDDLDSLWGTVDPRATKDPEARVPLIEIKRMMRFALYFLNKQPSLPTKILITAVRILKWILDQYDSNSDLENDVVNDFENDLFDYKEKFDDIRIGVHRILRDQPKLHDDVIVELRDMFQNRKEAVFDALEGHLQLFDEAYRWVLASATHHMRQAMENQYRLGDLPRLLRVLSTEPDLPDIFVNFLVYSFPKLLKEKIVGFDTPATLLSQQRKLSQEAVDGIASLLSYTDLNILESSWLPSLYKRKAFAEPLVDALCWWCKESNENQVKTLVRALRYHDDLNQKSIERLRELLDSDSIMPGPYVAEVYDLLSWQAKIDREDILTLNNILYIVPNEHKYEFEIFWRKRHLEQFVTSLESIEPFTIDRILKVLLRRSAEDITPIYLNGNTLHFLAADGKMKKLVLKDEQSFRKTYRKAQLMAGLPHWSCID